MDNFDIRSALTLRSNIFIRQWTYVNILTTYIGGMVDDVILKKYLRFYMLYYVFSHYAHTLVLFFYLIFSYYVMMMLS